jgi:hypothetical protein
VLFRPPRWAGAKPPVSLLALADDKLAGLWVDQTANINGNYAISDKPLTEQEWVEKHVKH